VNGRHRPGRRAALVALGCGVALVTMLGIPAHATYGARVTADEPQYLLSALSFGEDLDLDIRDEIEDERYRPFHRVDLDPQTEETARGALLSPHDPALPVLLAVPMRAGGWAVAKATLAVVAGALAALTAWVAIRRLGVAPRWAIAAVAVFAVSPPLAVYATQVYPELPAALVVMVVVAAATAPTFGRRAGAAVVIGVSLLPWLSVKYAPVAAALTLVVLVRLRHRPRAVVPLVGALALQGALYLLVHRAIYGGWTVYAVGDHFAETGEFSVVGVDPDYFGRSRRLVGLLVDRQFGLAAWMPAWLLVVPALAALARRRPPWAGVVVLPALAGWFVATFVALTMHGWWWPGRQVVVIAPLLVLVVAWWLPQVRLGPWLLGVGGALGIGSWLWTTIEAVDRRRVLVVDFGDTANPWYRLWRHALPDGAHAVLRDDLLTAGWVAVLAALAVWGWRAAPARRARRPNR
jgi:hypothetical protein